MLGRMAPGRLLSDHRLKFALHLINDPCPVSDLLLSKQPCTRIPWAIASIQQPSPIRIIGQQYPDRLTHRARKMSYARIDRDNHVHQIQQCSCIAEVSQIITKKSDATIFPKCDEIFFPIFFADISSVHPDCKSGETSPGPLNGYEEFCELWFRSRPLQFWV